MPDEKKPATPIPAGDKSNVSTTAAPNTQSTKPVAADSVTKPDPDHKPAVADEGRPPELSAEEQAKLESILDNDEAGVAANTAPNNDSARKLFLVLRSFNDDVPDEHIVWGTAAATLTVGDLRNLARMIR